jgi:phosphoglycerate kinase
LLLPLPAKVLLLENVRFHKGETKNDDAFAKQLASLADIYVDDAFGVVHRDQASVTASAESPQPQLSTITP